MKPFSIALLIAEVAILALVISFVQENKKKPEAVAPEVIPFTVKSIDTMKYSRDLAREKSNDSSFDTEIAAQMKLIKGAGATHAAISTPYDKEFVPMLTRWVNAARAEGLSVWFRGNFSGWEGWFNYSRISADTHKKLLAEFIANNPTLFADGDIFSACPECENGGPGDPRRTGKKNEFNHFLVSEYDIARDAFRKIGKDITLYTSMNLDIAREVINPVTAQKLGGTILADHYVSSVEKFGNDIKQTSQRLGAHVGLGEFGAPIPDINGKMTLEQQAQFVAGLAKAMGEQNILVMNYWTLKGGTTALVNSKNEPLPAYNVLKQFYTSIKNPPR